MVVHTSIKVKDRTSASRWVDITGQKFNRLLVLRFVGVTGTNDNYAVWECLCDCGNVDNYKASNLKRGDAQSCGCHKSDSLRKRLRKPIGAATVNERMAHYKCNAKRAGREFLLTSEEFKKLVLSPCYYCGLLPEKIVFHKKKRGKRVEWTTAMNGVDRVDNSRGYAADNCVACCCICNRGKMDRTVQDFLDWARRIHMHLSEHPEKLPPENPAQLEFAFMKEMPPAKQMV